VTCPRCGHEQPEPRAVYSTVCRQCGQHLRLQEVDRPVPPRPRRMPELKRITCFDCGAELEVALSAQSTICKWCSSYIDLEDYRIAHAVSRNFRTKGAFVVELKGYALNSEAVVGDAIIRGRFLGKLVATGTLTLYSTAEIKGSITAGCLVIPVGNHFRWQERIRVGSAHIAGELAADLMATGRVLLASTARLFGNLEARDLLVEAGAVVVGYAHVGLSAA
ncbi:MAG: hypothetical protein KGS61_20440, partial [Verrucomicrobia bacterium]|nr:hypothetical protein [Verrucomicrobiota bacterium]